MEQILNEFEKKIESHLKENEILQLITADTDFIKKLNI